MPTNFPISLDALTNPTAIDLLNSPSVPHAAQHGNANDAIEALQAKVGINDSSDVNSLDYKITLKANVASPTFTGTPAAPTAAAETNTTQLATTAHVFAERTNTATLTNKTISIDSNTLTGVAPLASPALTGNATLTTSTGVALTITNTGTDNTLVLNDETEDATPVVVTADGQLLVGSSVPQAGTNLQIECIQIIGTGAASSSVGAYSTSNTLTANFRQYRRRATGDGALVVNDALGANAFAGYTGSIYKVASSIAAAVDDAVTATSMPSRLVFNTTSVGGTAFTEKMRINKDGNVGIGTNNPTERLHVAGNALLTGSATLGSFTLATRPAHAAGKIIYVSDAPDGEKYQGSNGTTWTNLG